MTRHPIFSVLFVLAVLWLVGSAIYDLKVSQYEEYRQEHQECPCHTKR